MTDRPHSTDPSTEAVFRSISDQAQETNRIRVETLGGLVDDAKPGLPSGEDRRLAKDLSHQIAGSAGTFGFVRASELARQIESLLGAEDGQATADQLQDLLAELRASLE